jgi:hypothetical protein
MVINITQKIESYKIVNRRILLPAILRVFRKEEQSSGLAHD